MEIRKVLVRKDGIKFVIIPKKSEIEPGEHVMVSNDFLLINKFKKEEKNAKKRNRKN